MENNKPRDPRDVTVEHPKDARQGPVCSICGQPEEGHPKATETTGIHDFVTEEQATAERERAAKPGEPGTGVTPTEPTPPPTTQPPDDKQPS